MKQNAIIICLLILVGQGQYSVLHAQDSLYTRHGDLLMGKIEKIAAEKVFFKTAYITSALEIKLTEIAKIKSTEGYILNDIRNRNWKGQLVLDSASKNLIGIKTIDSVYYFSQKEIFEISIDHQKKFKDRFKLGIDLGYTRAKTDNTLALSIGLNSSYRTRRWATSLDYKDYAASIKETIVSRTSLAYDLSYILTKEWFFNGKFSSFSSTEQSLDLRKNFSLGMGKNLIHRRDRLLSIGGGIVSNNESYTDNATNFKSLEASFDALLHGKFAEKIDLSLDWSIFPSLTESARVRNNLNLDIKYLFLRHFNFGIHYVLNTDSKPPLETAKSDYMLEVKFGWTLQKR